MSHRNANCRYWNKSPASRTIWKNHTDQLLCDKHVGDKCFIIRPFRSHVCRPSSFIWFAWVGSCCASAWLLIVALSLFSCVSSLSLSLSLFLSRSGSNWLALALPGLLLFSLFFMTNSKSSIKKLSQTENVTWVSIQPWKIGVFKDSLQELIVFDALQNVVSSDWYVSKYLALH